MANTRIESIEVGLVEGRHPLPVSEYIWESIPDVLDFVALEYQATRFIEERVGISKRSSIGLNQTDYSEVECFRGDRELVVYVTGLTAATAAVIRVCALNGVRLTLMHFDMVSGTYVPQRIFGAGEIGRAHV